MRPGREREPSAGIKRGVETAHRHKWKSGAMCGCINVGAASGRTPARKEITRDTHTDEERIQPAHGWDTHGCRTNREAGGEIFGDAGETLTERAKRESRLRPVGSPLEWSIKLKLGIGIGILCGGSG